MTGQESAIDKVKIFLNDDIWYLASDPDVKFSFKIFT